MKKWFLLLWPNHSCTQGLSQDLKVGSPNFMRARHPARNQPKVRAQKNATEECNVHIHEYFYIIYFQLCSNVIQSF